MIRAECPCRASLEIDELPMSPEELIDAFYKAHPHSDELADRLSTAELAARNRRAAELASS